MTAQPWTVEEAGMGAVGDFKNFWFLEGVILDQSSSTGTSVYTNCTGGISSKTYTSQDIWIKTIRDGEVRIGLNRAIPLRAGQEAVIVCHQQTGNENVYCFLYIKNTGELYEISTKPFNVSGFKIVISILIGLVAAVILTEIALNISKGKTGEVIFYIGLIFSIIGIPLLLGADRLAKCNNLRDKLVYKYLKEGGDLTVNRTS